jgi:hypothetical protein
MEKQREEEEEEREGKTAGGPAREDSLARE